MGYKTTRGGRYKRLNTSRLVTGPLLLLLHVASESLQELYFRATTWKKPSILHPCCISLPYLVHPAWTKSQYFVWGWGGDTYLSVERRGLFKPRRACQSMNTWCLAFCYTTIHPFPSPSPSYSQDVANFARMTSATMALRGTGPCHRLPLRRCLHLLGKLSAWIIYNSGGSTERLQKQNLKEFSQG